ncbi:MAG: M14 family zinc carboxypeptidase, partial [Candidatus Hodarchaeota archaeon]
MNFIQKLGDFLKGDIKSPKLAFELPSYTDYRKSNEISRQLKELHENYEDITTLRSVGDSAKENRDIWLMSIGKRKEFFDNTPAILLIGCHHGREAISVETTLFILEAILQNRHHEMLASIIEDYAIHILIILNPDGRDQATRKNGRGVDLNRNYAFGWGGPGCSHNPSAQDYCGPNPMSETETQAVNALFKESPIKYTITYHSGIEAVLYPWGDRYESVPEEDLRVIKRIISTMDEYAKKMKVKTYD